MKCLIVLEFLVLNVDSGDELNQVRSCLTTHKQIIARQVVQYKIGFSNDGKMEVHERGIRKKGELLIQYLEDSSFLKKARADSKKNASKIRQQTESTMYDATNASNAAHAYNANELDFDEANGATFGEDDDDDYDESEMTYRGPDSQIPPPQRQRSKLEEQRRQRREVLRERIRNSEQQRKDKETAQKNTAVPDLIDFDTPEPADAATATTSTTTTTALSPDVGDDEDEFGDFQSDSSPTPAAANNNKTANMDDLLGLGTASTPAQTTSTKDKDPFADLFNNSKSLI